ncbi:SDR family NAD(P)-dependent oxidoreductase [Candidatus Enterococcus mansonii]|uniref:Uncharacterized protein n=1 Tax=Candidatus Enterococcus mansonii TaxID=1834181 RepID=A0A242C7K6_9ENTE|nr:SDR family oxidoreductase [Enterococcus sp. 4G2_DIV0659]OTO05772.1 hypothetical protein A5880_002947 [Enterococcus sp. 4G2_DIV0659]
MLKLSGKVMLITECDSSIGTTTAQLAAKEGAIVVCTGKNLKKIETILSDIKKAGGIGAAFAHDVSALWSWQQIVTETIKKFGKIDVLVNNAGISTPKLLSELTFSDWKKIQGIDVNSLTYGLKEVVPHMINNKGGSIINVSSIEGLTGLLDNNPYTAAKDVLRSITTNCAIDVAEHAIRVNAVCPGSIETPIIETTFPNNELHFNQSVKFPYLGKPEDIATSIIYLACDESSFVTGAELVIQGGRIAI